MVEADIVVPCY